MFLAPDEHNRLRLLEEIVIRYRIRVHWHALKRMERLDREHNKLNRRIRAMGKKLGVQWP